MLGPLEVVDDHGAAIDLGGGRERTLLALLLLARGEVVSTGRLADELWGERVPDGAAHGLRVHVSRLRRALRRASADGLLVTRPPGYVLRADAALVDAWRFEDLVTRARDEPPARAAGTLREALDLWRGSVLSDLAGSATARIEAERLEEARLEAFEERIEADLALGRHADVVGELAALTRVHPLRERLRAQHMLALYRCGRQAEALRCYTELRADLDTELGIEPSPALTRLHTAVLRQDVALDPDPAPEGRPARRQGGLDLPAPALLTEMGNVFVGRTAELERIEACWQAPPGGPQLVLLSGEPGVGKTRLAAEFAKRARAAGATVLAGRCDEDLGVPYQPFVEALRDYARSRADLGRYPGELARLIPEIAHEPGVPPPLRSDPETEQYRLFDAVASWLDTAASERPVLLVTDDLHWAARPTLHLLRHVTRSARAARLLIVGTYRDSELGRNHALVRLLADLRRQPSVLRIGLAGLDEAGVVAFLEHTAGHRLTPDDERLAGALHAETGGNPFFVREILRHLVETGAVDRRGGRWGIRTGLDGLGIPDGVREVVGRRLSRLSDEAVAVLRVGAVIGPEFDLPLLSAASGSDGEALLAVLDEAIESRLMIEKQGGGPHFRFAHAIVRSTLHDSLGTARRMAIHRRVAGALERLAPEPSGDQLAALAHHWSRGAGAPHERALAVEYSAKAAERALAQLAHEEAAAHYQRALDLLPATAEAEQVELLIGMGEAQRRAGDAAHRQTLLAASGLARRRGDAAGQARAAIANSPGSKPSIFGVTDHERVVALEAALDAVGPVDSADRARLLATLALELFHSDDRDRRLRLSDDALALARRLDRPELLAQVLAARPFAIGGPDTLERRVADTAELLRVAERLADPVTTHRAWWSRFRVAVEVGDTVEADRCLAAQSALVASTGQPTIAWMTGLQQVARALRRGEFDAAAGLLPDVLGQGRQTGQPDARLYFAIQLFQLCYEQGRPDDAEETVRTVVAASPELPSIHMALALLHAEQGRPDDARALFDGVARAGFDALPVEASTMVAWTFAADLAASLDDRERAAQLHPLLEPYPEQVAVWAVGLGTGSVSHRLGRLARTLGELDHADAHYAVAAAVEERAGAPTWLARTRLEWAQVLLERGRPADRDGAAELLRLCRTTAAATGLRRVAERAERLAAAERRS